MSTAGTSLPTLHEAAAVLAEQSFGQLLGMELTAFSAGDVELLLAIRPELLQQHGVLHGGVLAALADNALAFAAGSVLGPQVVTAGFRIDFLRPATGDFVRAVAHVVSCSAQAALCRCDLYAGARGRSSVHAASAQGQVTLTLGRTPKQRAEP